MKRVILRVTLMVAAVLLSCANLWAAESGKCGENLTWTLDDNGVLTISGTGKMDDYSSSSSAPWGRNAVKSVVFKDGVTSIGARALYYCSGLTSVEIGNSVTSIGQKTFAYCNGLTSVSIPNSVNSIGGDAFAYCSGLTSVTIGNGVTSIGIRAFEYCRSLTSVVFNAEKCTQMGNTSSPVFKGCESLKTLTIGDKVKLIPDYAFSFCDGLMSVSIPNSVTNIGNYTFAKCSGMTSVTIGNSVASIGEGAFYGCSGVTSVEIGNSVTSIGESAFEDCSGVTKISVSAKTPPTCGNYAFDGVDKQNCKLEVPQESLEAYKAADTWKEFSFNIITGIGEIETGGVKVSVTKGEIAICGAADDAEVEICGMNGAVVYCGIDKTIAVPSPGIYIVRVAGKTIKVAL